MNHMNRNWFVIHLGESFYFWFWFISIHFRSERIALIHFDSQFISIFIHFDLRFNLILFILIQFDFDLSPIRLTCESWFTCKSKINSISNQSESRIKLVRDYNFEISQLSSNPIKIYRYFWKIRCKSERIDQIRPSWKNFQLSNNQKFQPALYTKNPINFNSFFI